MHNSSRNADTFVSSVLEAFQNSTIENLENLYKQLSEEENMNTAKAICTTIHDKALDKILNTIKGSGNDTITMLLKLYAWHFLQLATSSSVVKAAIKNDYRLLPALMALLTHEFDDIKRMESLQIVTLNYLIVMLGEAEDSYYNHVTECGVFPFIHNMLELSSLSDTNTLIEMVILLMNLLLEGTSACKAQFTCLNFEQLLAKKIKDRRQCDERLFKVAQMTHQKLLLLTSEKQTFVETFRKGFEEEAKKQELYQDLKCTNKSCGLPYESSFKRCSRCKKALYCSKKCQVNDWKNSHSKSCSQQSS